MSALASRIEEWAAGEVASGRASSVEQATAAHHSQVAAFRATLDAAQAEADAGLTYSLDEVAAELEAMYPDE